MKKLPLIGHDALSPEWFAARSQSIGASEIAAAAVQEIGLCLA